MWGKCALFMRTAALTEALLEFEGTFLDVCSQPGTRLWGVKESLSVRKHGRLNR